MVIFCRDVAHNCCRADSGRVQCPVFCQASRDEAGLQVNAFLIIVGAYWAVHYLFASQVRELPVFVDFRGQLLVFLESQQGVAWGLRAMAVTFRSLSQWDAASPFWRHRFSAGSSRRWHMYLLFSNLFSSCWLETWWELHEDSGVNQNRHGKLSLKPQNLQLLNPKASTPKPQTPNPLSSEVQTGTPPDAAFFALAFASNLFATLTPYA